MANDFESRDLAARPRDVALAPANPSKYSTRTHVLAGVGGVGSGIVSGLGLTGTFMAIAEKGLHGGNLAAGLFLVGWFVGSLALTRWAVRSHRRAAASLPPAPEPALFSASAIRQHLLAVAADHGGRVTAAEVAAALAIEQPPAERALDAAAEAGEARMLFSPEGIAVYEFSGLVAHKAEAKEPWEL